MHKRFYLKVCTSFRNGAFRLAVILNLIKHQFIFLGMCRSKQFDTNKWKILFILTIMIVISVKNALHLSTSVVAPKHKDKLLSSKLLIKTTV